MTEPFSEYTIDDLDHPMVMRWAWMAEGKLIAEGLSLDSPMDEIEKCFSEVVCPELCIALVKLLREKKT